MRDYGKDLTPFSSPLEPVSLFNLGNLSFFRGPEAGSFSSPFHALCCGAVVFALFSPLFDPVRFSSLPVKVGMGSLLSLVRLTDPLVPFPVQ